MMNFRRLVISTLAAIGISRVYESLCSKAKKEEKLFYEALILLGTILIVLNIRCI